MKSQEQLNEQAEVAQILRRGMASGIGGSAHLADLILKSDWLAERDERMRRAGREGDHLTEVAVSIVHVGYDPQKIVQVTNERLQDSFRAAGLSDGAA